jgi:hypothetical protein
MRTPVLLILLATSLTAFAATPARPAPRLLNYREVMLLSKEKRVNYLRQMAGLLALMEKTQHRYEIAGDYGRLRDEVALLIRAASLWPEAAAASSSTSDIVASITPVWNEKTKTWTCSHPTLARFDSRAGTCVVIYSGEHNAPTSDWERGSCPRGSHTVTSYTTNWYWSHVYDLCVPQASWDRLPGSRRLALSTTYDFLPEDYFSGKSRDEALAVIGDAPAKPARLAVDNVTGAGIGTGVTNADAASADATASGEAKPAEAKPGGDEAKAAAKDDAKCAPPSPNLACRHLDGPTREVLVAQFRKSATGGECISGGFFSKYRGGVNRRGGCIVPRAFPDEKSSTRCEGGRAMCNPLVFCLGVDLSYKDKGGADVKGFLPENICVPINQDITSNCERQYQARIGQTLDAAKLQKEMAKRPDLLEIAKTQKARVCDPATDVKNLPFQDEYDKLVADLSANYNRLCAGDSGFQALFCTECGIIGRHIFSMRRQATGSGCGTGEATPSTEPKKVTPSSDSTTTI